MSVDEAKLPQCTRLNDLWVIRMEPNLVSHGLRGQVVYEESTDGKRVEELEAVVSDWKEDGGGSGGHNPQSGGLAVDAHA